MIQVRQGQPADAPAIAALSGRVQNQLTASGSLQQFGPLSEALVLGKMPSGSVWVLDKSGEIVGAVFVEPTTRMIFPELATWRVDEARRLLYLSKLMVDPEQRGQGLSTLLLNQAKSVADATSNSLLILDCWASNEKLRRLYSNAGFALHGEFPEENWYVAVFTYTAET